MLRYLAYLFFSDNQYSSEEDNSKTTQAIKKYFNLMA